MACILYLFGLHSLKHIESPTSLLRTQETSWITGTKPIEHLTAPGTYTYTHLETGRAAGL